ncbi:calcium-binding protein [Neptunicoccus sediminis]|uniref:calcium-binding protein n=1 Tax=Neptunicoccus sediminis TaxID=1892596 RepID=UPI0009F58F25|nr:calcium-binding protein [Neptunicoccus sediminis]
MAIRVYKKGKGDVLKGTVGSDSYRVDLDRLRYKTLELEDRGGAADELAILDSDGKWAAKWVLVQDGALVWNGAGVGRIAIPLNGAGAPKIETLRFGSSKDDLSPPLTLTTDLQPESGQSLLIAGTRGADRIIGPDATGKGPGSLVYGGGGADRISAGSGEDYTVYGGGGGDVISTAGPARAQFYGQTGKDILFGCSGNDWLYGGAGGDQIYGGAGSDLLAGGGKGDTLSGGDGADRINGGKGNDLLTGGAGADVFVFNASKSEGRDRIEDFTTGVDRLQVKGESFGALELEATGAESTDTLVVLPSGTRITLVGHSLSDTTEADFLF